MKLARVWTFLAGDSRAAPLAVGCAVLAVLILQRLAPSARWIGPLYAATLAAGLVAAVFERTR